jgi:N-acyl-phosphatidylethanolamine-hydrolysing phospholipase D
MTVSELASACPQAVRLTVPGLRNGVGARRLQRLSSLGALRLLILGMVLTAMLPSAGRAGAPRDGDRFMNTAGPLQRGGASVALPFFARKAWTTLTSRGGAAPLVPYDATAILHNPSITWIGHATMLVRMDGATFLTDPMFSERASPVSFAGPRRVVAPGIPIEALPSVDFATLSHDHYDHTDLASIRRLGQRGVRFIVPLGLAELVRDAGAAVQELDWWESVEVGNVRVHCVPAQHFSGRGVIGHDRRLWAGWVVVGPTRRFYHAGDTGYGPDFVEIGRRLGPMNLASIPIGAYEPRAMMRAVHVNPEEAVQVAVDVGARHAVGMHFGTFDLTDEPMDEAPKRFHAEAAQRGLPQDTTWVLNVGETRRW